MKISFSSKKNGIKHIRTTIDANSNNSRFRYLIGLKKTYFGFSFSAETNLKEKQIQISFLHQWLMVDDNQLLN